MSQKTSAGLRQGDELILPLVRARYSWVSVEIYKFLVVENMFRKKNPHDFLNSLFNFSQEKVKEFKG